MVFSRVTRGRMDVPRGLRVTQSLSVLKSLSRESQGRKLLVDLSTLTGWRGVVTSIRHAAVHRIPQDRKSLLKLIRVAIKFSQCTIGLEYSESLCRL
jgi:hypothetical protein